LTNLIDWQVEASEPMSTQSGSAVNDHTPRYAARGDFARPTGRPVAAAFRCNVCNHACESNEALRAHYAAQHPQELARLEALTARLGQPPARPRA
jgi:hypothetical protein